MVFALETPEPEASLSGVLRAGTVSVEHKIPKCCDLPAHEPLRLTYHSFLELICPPFLGA